MVSLTQSPKRIFGAGKPDPELAVNPFSPLDKDEVRRSTGRAATAKADGFRDFPEPDARPESPAERNPRSHCERDRCHRRMIRKLSVSNYHSIREEAGLDLRIPKTAPDLRCFPAAKASANSRPSVLAAHRRTSVRRQPSVMRRRSGSITSPAGLLFLSFIDVATHDCEPPVRPLLRKGLLPDVAGDEQRVLVAEGGSPARHLRAPDFGRTLIPADQVHEARPHTPGACPALPTARPRVRVRRTDCACRDRGRSQPPPPGSLLRTVADHPLARPAAEYAGDLPGRRRCGSPHRGRSPDLR